MERGLGHARTLATVIAALHPRLWGLHLLGLLAVTAAVALGIWQWNVGDGRKATQANEYAHAAPSALASVISPGASFPAAQLGRPVRVTGSWLPDSLVFVSSGDGYWVAQAVRSGDAAIYVVRGSVRSTIAPVMNGHADLVGWLQPNQSSTTPADHRTLPAMSNGLAAPFVPVTLVDGFVVAETPTADLTAVPEPQLPAPSFWTGLRNWSYAIEWWIFGFFAAYVWWRRVGELITPPVPSET
jgi:cytochrome oxidase assembly protein ShyY1